MSENFNQSKLLTTQQLLHRGQQFSKYGGRKEEESGGRIAPCSLDRKVLRIQALILSRLLLM